MKNIINILLITMFTIACEPSEAVIQKAIYQTQTAEISTIKTQATKAPIKTPTPSCEVLSNLKSNWKTILCDTFDNSQSDWYVGKDTSDLAEIDVFINNGQYIIDITGKPNTGYKGGVIQWFGLANAQNFMASIDGKISSKNRGVAWGINFRGKDNNFFSFVIGKEGWYRLDMLKNNDWFYPIKTKMNNAIKWDDSNNLSIVAEDEKFYFYVNDILIDSYESDNKFGTEISLVVSADEGASATFFFDNALIKTN